MKHTRPAAIGWVAALWLVFLTACGGLPGDLKKEVRSKIDTIGAAESAVGREKADYIDLQKTDRFAFFETYANRERWPAHFTQAEKQLEQAKREVTSGRVAFLLKENRKEKAGALRIELAKLDRLIREAKRMSRAPTDRMAELERIRNEAPQRVAAAEHSEAQIQSIVRDLAQVFVPTAQKDYPKRADAIARRFEPLARIAEQSASALADARRHLDRHTAGQRADYAVLGVSTARIQANLEKLKEQDAAYRAKIGELYQSYTKVLQDMRIEHFVTLGRVSWDEDSDFWREHNYIYPPSKVDRKTRDYFARLDPRKIPATYSKFWGGRVKVFVPNDQWRALNIRPDRNWPSRSDDLAEFWIEDVFDKAYHRYLLVQGGKQQQTDWVPVDPEDYYDDYDFLGMEIVSKPYGVFEEEKVSEASPPGMAFVGDERYGQWQTDPSTGRSFWHYYGLYAFLNRGPGGYTYRSDWNRWRQRYRNRKPYFGGSSATGPVYGTSGTLVRTDSRYRNTDFAKRGGLRTQAASVRGAGPARRGGGPGGSGK